MAWLPQLHFPRIRLRHGEENDKLTQISVRTLDVPNLAAAMQAAKITNVMAVGPSWEKDSMSPKTNNLQRQQSVKWRGDPSTLSACHSTISGIIYRFIRRIDVDITDGRDHVRRGQCYAVNSRSRPTCDRWYYLAKTASIIPWGLNTNNCGNLLSSDFDTPCWSLQMDSGMTIVTHWNDQ